MNVEYQSFLDKKKPRALATGIEPPALNPALFDFQSACVDFALRTLSSAPPPDDAPLPDEIPESL